MWRWIKRLFAVLLVAVVAAGAGAYWLQARLHEPFRGYDTPDVFVDIPAGSGPTRIGERLVDAGVVPDAWTFRAGLLLSGRARALKAGEYRFDAPLDPLAVIDKIARGDVYKRLLTFREGLTVRETAQVFEERGFGQSDAFMKAASNVSLVSDLDPLARDLEGYLFPETYSLPRGTPASAVIEQMVANAKNALSPDVLEGAKRQGLTVRQLVTLASLVEKETASASERPLVAAVYRNRMKINMGMQADPTVIYALEQVGKYRGNLTKDNLQFDSPYNTYRYPGLPPGPIASPGRASIEAAAKPADVDYLYFVSKNDGTHVFASTLAEHNRNVFTWQVEYFRKQRAAAKH